MSAQDAKLEKLPITLFVPPELQRRGFQNRQIFLDLGARAFEPVPRGLKQVQPWCRWQGLSKYLDFPLPIEERRDGRERPNFSLGNIAEICYMQWTPRELAACRSVGRRTIGCEDEADGNDTKRIALHTAVWRCALGGSR